MEHLHKEVQAQITIGDPQAALLLIEKAEREKQESNELFRLKIKCLAIQEDIPSLIQAYSSLSALDESLLEEISWAIIRKAARSSSPILRHEAVLSAFITNDARSIPLCVQGLEDQSLEVRNLSLQLAAHARDEVIKEKVFQIFKQSDKPSDRYAAILALKNLDTVEVKNALTTLIAQDSTPINEKVAAVETMAILLKGSSPTAITELLSSPRAGLRALACDLVLESQDQRLLPLIIPCLFDDAQEVRLAALSCVGISQAKNLVNYDSKEFLELVCHKDAKTAILANWILLLQHSPKTRLQEYLLSSDQEQAQLTASCLAHAGPSGIPLMIWGMKASKDPLVQLNLAIGLIWQQKELELAEKVIVSTLQNKQERLSWQHLGHFSWIGKTSLSHAPHIVSLPETEDLLTRLELLKMVASYSPSNLKSALVPLLKERAWGVSSLAASLMMHTRLDDGFETFEQLEALLDDKNPEIALQAAFMLASYTQDERALKVFETSYPEVSRQMKEQIIVGIGQIGSKKSLPFLVTLLNSPFETIRVSAARSILLCLYY